MSVSSVSGGGYQASSTDPSKRLQNFLDRLKNDDSSEGKALYSAFQKLDSDVKGSADQSTLDADRQSINTAMKAFREAHKPDGPPPPGGPDAAQAASATDGTQQAGKAHHHHHHGGGGQGGAAGTKQPGSPDWVALMQQLESQGGSLTDAEPGQLVSASA